MTKTASSAMRIAVAVLLSVAGVAAANGSLPAEQSQATTAKSAPAAGVLKAADMASLMPAQVFFRGQSATVQMRNSGGVRFADGMFTLVALVDTSGYSSGIQQRYQAYLITEVPLAFGDGSGSHPLPPGAYGVGFIQDDRFIVMDLGAHELMNVSSAHDAALRRAMPLQVLESTPQGEYRLYEGRNYVTVRRAE